MTRSSNRRRNLAIAALSLGLLLSGCGGDDGGGGGESAAPTLSGSIQGDGSSTVFPITQAIAEEFTGANPDVDVSVGVSGTGGGFEKFCGGETDIQNASRPIDQEEEVPLCKQNRVEYVELQVAIDGLSVVTNPENDFVQCLTVDELEKVWRPGSKVDNWNQIRPGFPDKELTLYGPGTDSGTFDYFTEAIVGEEGASRSDYTPSEDDNVLVQGVAGDPNALGYFGYAYYQQNQNELKGLGVDDGDGCVRATEESIVAGDYKPLSRPLFVYVSKKGAARREVEAFVDFYLAEVNALVSEVGYIPVPEDAMQSETEEWDAFKRQA